MEAITMTIKTKAVKIEIQGRKRTGGTVSGGEISTND